MELIEQLKIEETKLMEKISNTENEATYRNLIRNLAEVTQLRQREENGLKCILNMKQGLMIKKTLYL